MGHFAELDNQNNVKQVIVVSNEELLIDGVESEQKGIDFCQSLFGNESKWIQTSYNQNFRKNYASVGYKYDSDLDAFIPPRCHDDAILNEDTARWFCENEAHDVIS